MNSEQPCNCEQSIRLALELATERDKLTRIAILLQTMPPTDEQHRQEYAADAIRQIAEILAEAPGERP